MTDQGPNTPPDSTPPIGTGADAPASSEGGAARTFDVLPLSPEVRRALEEMGYESPTPVQAAVFEPATRGKDIVVQARTGTGKTASFGLPIVDHLVRRSLAEPQALVLCPTRELALQVAAEIEKLGKYRDVKIVAVYGGASMERQIAGIQGGAQVVVGTPGRVLDHIRRRTLPVQSIRLLVLDESDEMLSMGFEKELSAILEALPAARQTLLFSATVPPDIERIARNKLKSPEFLTLSGDHIGALEVQHFVYLVQGAKIGTLVRILEAENPESAIIFCNTREETETVASALCQRGFDADWLNGDLPQSEREKVMTRTKQGKLRFLVATDVAARGIDVSHLTHVINFDFPQDAEAYVHRTGRTGRAGRTGTAISLILPQDIGGLYYLRLTYRIRPVERQIPTAEELRTRAETDLVTMLADMLLPKGFGADDRALARRLLTHDQAEAITAGLLRTYLETHPDAQEEAVRARRQLVRRAAQRKRAAVETPRPAQPSPEGQPTQGGEARPRPAPAAQPEGRGAPDDRERRPRGRREGGPGQEARPDRRPAAERGAQGPGRRAPAGSSQRAPAGRALANWSPPEEEGDDEPVLPARERAARGRTHAADARGELAGPLALHSLEGQRPGGAPDDADAVPYVELFIGVGRRDGARAQDLLRALVERAGIDKDHIRRIRVRDRHAFVAVRKDDASGAIERLNGTQIAGKASTTVELARERGTADEAGPDAPKNEAVVEP